MPRIDDYSEAVAPVAPEVSSIKILALFEADPELQLLPVLDGDRVVGLIERSAFFMRLTVSPAVPLTAAQVMDSEPIVVDGSIGARALTAILLKGGVAAVMRGFIVTRAGQYCGVGAPANLLRALDGTASEDTPTGPALAGTVDDRAALMTMIDREMRMPINGIAAEAALLRRLSLSKNILEHVNSIEEQARSLMAVIQDAGTLAGLATPQQIRATPLRALMDDVEREWSEKAAATGVTLMVGYEGDTELSADLDSERLRRVFDNLISNALKSARDGMVEAHLKAQVLGSDIHLSARVRDDGACKELVKSNRMPNSTGETTLDYMGGNFALSVSRKLIVSLEGHIWAENNAGRGVTINFELDAPRSAPEIETVSNIETLGDLDLNAAPHILIVDDNATNRVVAQALCEMFGCSCETAEDGLEALEAVQARSFDLILMDIKMPRMDGIQATQAIRALDGPESRVPIIALTANADPVDVACYISSGMASVVEKPIKPERLRMAMNAALVDGPAQPETDSSTSTDRRTG